MKNETPVLTAEQHRRKIDDYLDMIEKDQGIHIILAVESGSREWGMPSATSDFDVRFIYMEKPERRFRAYTRTIVDPEGTVKVNLDHRRNAIGNEVISHLNIDPLYDFSGWELGKALVNINETNISIVNWLKSSIRYREHRRLMKFVNTFIPSIEKINHLSYIHSNLSVCLRELNNMRKEGDEIDNVKIKTALYFVHHLVCAAQSFDYVDEKFKLKTKICMVDGASLANWFSGYKEVLNAKRTEELTTFAHCRDAYKDVLQDFETVFKEMNEAFDWKALKDEMHKKLHTVQYTNHTLTGAYNTYYRDLFYN